MLPSNLNPLGALSSEQTNCWLHARYQNWIGTHCQDSIGANRVAPDLAMVVMYAVDGLMFSESLQCDPYSPAERKRLIAVLMRLAETGYISDGKDDLESKAITPAGERIRVE